MAVVWKFSKSRARWSNYITFNRLVHFYVCADVVVVNYSDVYTSALFWGEEKISLKQLFSLPGCVGSVLFGVKESDVFPAVFTDLKHY